VLELRENDVWISAELQEMDARNSADTISKFVLFFFKERPSRVYKIDIEKSVEHNKR
jgi:hypothetical protein